MSTFVYDQTSKSEKANILGTSLVDFTQVQACWESLTKRDGVNMPIPESACGLLNSHTVAMLNRITSVIKTINNKPNKTITPQTFFDAVNIIVNDNPEFAYFSEIKDEYEKEHAKTEKTKKKKVKSESKGEAKSKKKKNESDNEDKSNEQESAVEESSEEDQGKKKNDDDDGEDEFR